MPKRGLICRHCNKAKVNRPRGLCWQCYYTPGVQELYPASTKYAGREPTQAEVDAMVAEGMKNLPEWWEKSREIDE